MSIYLRYIGGIIIFLHICAGSIYAKEGRFNDKAQRHIDLAKYVAGFSDYERAAMHYEEALKEEPRSKTILFTLGALYQKTGRNADAEKTYKKLLDLYPMDANAHVCMGNVYLSERRLNRAVKSFQQAADLNRKSAIAYRNLGYAELQAGAVNSAIQSLRRAVALNPTNSLVYFDLGVAYHMLGEKKAAQRTMRKGLELAMSAEGRIVYTEVLDACAEERFNRGYAAYCSNNMIQAEYEFSSIIKDFPDYAKAHAYLGHALYHQKPPKPIRAEAAYRAALSAKKYNRFTGVEYVLVLDNLGMIRMNAGDFLEAENLFKLGTEEDTQYPVVYFNYGCVLARKGIFSSAAVAFADALRRDKRLLSYLNHHPGLKPFRQSESYTNLLNTIKEEKIDGTRSN
jgi:tetratricopeptide (TPR) repeat protein